MGFFEKRKIKKLEEDKADLNCRLIQQKKTIIELEHEVASERERCRAVLMRHGGGMIKGIIPYESIKDFIPASVEHHIESLQRGRMRAEARACELKKQVEQFKIDNDCLNKRYESRLKDYDDLKDKYEQAKEVTQLLEEEIKELKENHFILPKEAGFMPKSYAEEYDEAKEELREMQKTLDAMRNTIQFLKHRCELHDPAYTETDSNCYPVPYMESLKHLKYEASQYEFYKDKHDKLRAELHDVRMKFALIDKERQIAVQKVQDLNLANSLLEGKIFNLEAANDMVRQAGYNIAKEDMDKLKDRIDIIKQQNQSLLNDRRGYERQIKDLRQSVENCYLRRAEEQTHFEYIKAKIIKGARKHKLEARQRRMAVDFLKESRANLMVTNMDLRNELAKFKSISPSILFKQRDIETDLKIAALKTENNILRAQVDLWQRKYIKASNRGKSINTIRLENGMHIIGECNCEKCRKMRAKRHEGSSC